MSVFFGFEKQFASSREICEFCNTVVRVPKTQYMRVLIWNINSLVRGWGFVCVMAGWQVKGRKIC